MDYDPDLEHEAFLHERANKYLATLAEDLVEHWDKATSSRLSHGLTTELKRVTQQWLAKAYDAEIVSLGEWLEECHHLDLVRNDTEPLVLRSETHRATLTEYDCEDCGARVTIRETTRIHTAGVAREL